MSWLLALRSRSTTWNLSPWSSPSHVRLASSSMSESLKRLAADDGSISPPATRRKIQTSNTGTHNDARYAPIPLVPSPDVSSSTAVANFFKPTSQKDPEKTAWRTVDSSLLVCRYDKPDQSADNKPRKIAAFDFDSTLVTSASGKKFAQGAEDWKWWHPHVPAKLKELVGDGYLVVILSNQGGIGLDPNSRTAKSDLRRLTDFKQKVKTVLHQLDLPISLYAATGKDKYRKPRVGMWDTLLEDQGLHSKQVDLQASLFVGDAGGRTASGKMKADFSCSDRDLAANIGIDFHTPEEFFLHEEVRPFARVFDPSTYLATAVLSSSEKTNPLFTRKNELDLVVFCGSPGAGKSTFFWDNLYHLGYTRINQDILGSRKACIQGATKWLEEGVSVVVDNTNADVTTRAQWIDLAKTFGVSARCVLFTAPARLCEHNDAVRAMGGEIMNPEERKGLPKVAFTSFSSRYREPSLEEGFEDITRVDFKFVGTEEQRILWGKYWI